MSTGRATLSRFTPSLMPHDLLERLFVARERTLEAIMQRVDAAATSEERNHTLLVGPRGAGKTHLVSLVYHRVNQSRADGARLQVAWLPEDPWTIASYRHLLSAIAAKLEPKGNEEAPGTAEGLEHFLTDRANANGPIVVIVENLDQILSIIGTNGQQQLRHFLQAERSLLLVTTSTRLDRALSDQASPFYGFFTTTRLKPFDVAEAAAMLTAIAEERGDDKLVDYLGSDEGRARLRTISHLAGGQPRMWAALASALTVDGLDELVDLLLTRFDDLTPYYQEQLGRLSPQQRIVVAALAELDRPINVKELAGRIGLEERSLGKTMSELVDRGWASPVMSSVTADLIDKRKTYYELAEPLARISFQIKESRGEPLRVVVEFLKHWFDPEELARPSLVDTSVNYMLLASRGQEHDPVVAVTRRLHRLPATRAPTVSLLTEIDDALAMLAHHDPEAFLRLPMPVRVALERRLTGASIGNLRLDIHEAAQLEFGHTRHPHMEEWIRRAEGLVATSAGELGASAQLVLADWLARAWHFDQASEIFSAVMASGKQSDVAALAARTNMARACSEAGDGRRAVDLTRDLLHDYERLLGTADQGTLAARNNLALAYARAGQFDQAIAAGRTALAEHERVLGRDHPATLQTRMNVALTFAQAEPTAEAVELTETTFAAYERALGSTNETTLRCRAHLALVYGRAGRAAEAIELTKRVVEQCEKTVGHDDPDTLNARTGLALMYWLAGEKESAITLEEAVLSVMERRMGDDHPDTLMARSNLALSYGLVGRSREAITLGEAVLARYENVLGTAHPASVRARQILEEIRRTSHSRS